MLKRNAELNGLTNVTPRPEGLWNNSTTTLKLVGYDSFAAAETADAGADDAFKTVTIADYLRASNVDQLDLIVIDIEGAELAALEGALPFLDMPAGKAPNILFEVHRHYVDWSNGLENTPICSRWATLVRSTFSASCRRAEASTSSSCRTIPPGSAHRPTSGSRPRCHSSTCSVGAPDPFGRTVNTAASTSANSELRDNGVGGGSTFLLVSTMFSIVSRKPRPRHHGTGADARRTP
jgi:FkbM family methyltransferase